VTSQSLQHCSACGVGKSPWFSSLDNVWVKELKTMSNNKGASLKAMQLIKCVQFLCTLHDWKCMLTK